MIGTQVITTEQAKKITGGREPLLPAEYEEACKALSACVNIDEAKYWSEKADVLAAWAKIYHSDDVLRKAKILKLHAYRRMSQLADEIRPFRGGQSVTGGRAPGPNSFLHEQGFSKYKTQEIRAVGRAPQPIFDRAIKAKNPPAPSTFKRMAGDGDDEGRSFLLTVYTFRDFCKKNSPEDLIPLVVNKDHLRAAAILIMEWTDRLEQLCGKETDS